MKNQTTEQLIDKIKKELREILSTQSSLKPVTPEEVREQLLVFLAQRYTGRRKVGFIVDAEQDGDVINLIPGNLLTGLVMQGFLLHELPPEVLNKPNGEFKTEKGIYRYSNDKGFTFQPVNKFITVTIQVEEK